jgi:hypothetical protein
MEKDLETVTGLPPNAGTRALRKREATQPPTGVPANGAPITVAVVTRPLGAKVTCTLPTPVGPPGFLQELAADEAAPSAEMAEALLKGASVVAGGGAASSFFVVAAAAPV